VELASGERDRREISMSLAVTISQDVVVEFEPGETRNIVLRLEALGGGPYVGLPGDYLVISSPGADDTEIIDFTSEHMGSSKRLSPPDSPPAGEMMLEVFSNVIVIHRNNRVSWPRS
jgi:hypothetical protein